MKNKLTLFTLIAILPLIASAQIQYDLHVNYGMSNFIEKNKDKSIIIGNYYTPLQSYSLGLNGFYPFTDSKFGIKSGLMLSSFASKNHMPDEFDYTNYTGPKSWDEKFYAASLPIRLNYKFEEWIHINMGISNTLTLNNPKEIFDKKIHNYTLNFVGGIDFIIKNKCIVGASYYKDIRPTMAQLKEPNKPETININYSIEQITLKIGYIINKNTERTTRID